MLGAHRVLLDAFESDVRPLLTALAGGTRAGCRSRRDIQRPAATQSELAAERGSVCGRERVRDDVIQRSAFVLRVRPDKIDEYVAAHRARLAGHAPGAEASRGSGTTRSSATGTRCSATSSPTTWTRAAAYLGRQEVCARWQDAMADLLEERVPDCRAAAARGDLPTRLKSRPERLIPA